MSDRKQLIHDIVFLGIIPIAGIFLSCLLTWYLTNLSTEKSAVKDLSLIFETIDEKMQYEEAMKIAYETSLEKSETIKEQASTIEKLRSDNKKLDADLETEKNEAIEAAKQYAAEEKFELAITTLKGIHKGSELVEALLNEYEKQFEANLSQKIESLILEKRYDEASELVSNALKVMPDSKFLKDEKQYINDKKPRYMLNILSPYEKYYYKDYSGDGMQMGGEKYFHGFSLDLLCDYSYVIFNLNGNYSNLEGIVGHIDGSGRNNATVTFYLDDIAIQAIEVDFENLPQSFQIDLTGAKKLKIQTKYARRGEIGLGELLIY